MPFAQLADFKMHYEELGTGVPLIAVHGWLGTARTDLGHVLDWLATRYHVYGVTLRGYGESRPPQRDFPDDFYERDASDLLSFMDALNIEQAHVFGYSDGGEVALIAAGQQPTRFLSVATVGSVGYFGAGMRPVAQRNAPATFLENDPELMARHGITNAKQFVGQWIRAIVHMIDAGGDISMSYAPHMSMPILMMLGEEDRLNPREYGEKFIEKLPHHNGTLAMFACGHPIHDQQTEAFRKVYGEFLRG